MDIPENIRFADDGHAVDIVDQTKLPAEEVHLVLRTREECRRAIERLEVRGAPAIGIFAAFSLAALSYELPSSAPEEFYQAFAATAAYLVAARPTAVNVAWACKRMQAVVDTALAMSEPWEVVRKVLLEDLHNEALSIQHDDIVQCKFMATRALTLLNDGDGIITHCNAGPLATSCYGTALGPILLGTQWGMQFHVYADETRPLLQGARLTTYELQKAGIDTTLLCDNMASVLMEQGKIQACLVGADRVAANGDVANKIGTNQLAIVAHYYGVPFYVVCPTSTVDKTCATGADIPIEERSADEVTTQHYVSRMAPEGISVFNPAFDVVDHTLVSAIVTEGGIWRPHSA